MRLISLAAVLALLAPASALAQPMPAAAEACPATPAALPANLAAWTKPAPLAAATDEAGAANAALTVGQAADASLPLTGDVRYAQRPVKPGGSVSHGGIFSVQIAKAGDYTIALGTGAWIDVLRDGKALESTAHGRGPACTTLRKMVTFPLQPGRYLIQISANAEPKIAIMVAPAS